MFAWWDVGLVVFVKCSVYLPALLLNHHLFSSACLLSPIAAMNRGVRYLRALRCHLVRRSLSRRKKRKRRQSSRSRKRR